MFLPIIERWLKRTRHSFSHTHIVEKNKAFKVSIEFVY